MTPGRWAGTAVFAAAAALAGCVSLAPRYSRPAAPVPSAWPGSAAGEAVAGEPGRVAADVPWREFVLDGRLQQVIGLALANSRDLRVAVLDVEKSRALFQIQRAELFPELKATGGASAQRVPADLSPTGAATTSHQYSLAVGVSSYELDLFGRVRSLKEAALAQYLATEQAQRAVRVSLVSQVATTWLGLAADRERLALARETFAAQQESLRLTQARFEAGVASALDVNQARTGLEDARADIARSTALVDQDGNALALAVGSTVAPELLPEALSAELTALRALAPGLPSAVLLGRPDVLEAEDRLKGANANIGAARAAFFPRIALTASAGLASASLSGLFDGGAQTWSFVPQISLPIFDAGANRANLAAARVDREIALAQYEKAIQTAFREVADALAQRATIDDQLAANLARAEAAAESNRLSRARYEKGADSYLVVLDSQRTLYAAQQNVIQTRLARLVNQATLYKVLGGGAAE